MKNNMKITYTIPICLTHRCNLNCIYCFQKHDNQHEMSFEKCKSCIDWIFDHILCYENNRAEITFFGGEPLLRFDLIKSIFDYTITKYKFDNYRFFASTNGTILTDEMKKWFHNNKDRFVLGLSLDGGKVSQDENRSNSFNLIDFHFFLFNSPKQNVKMTISEKSIYRYSEDVKYIHSLGFGINGADLCVGTFNWSSDKYIKVLAPQLKNLIDYYIDNPNQYNALFKKDLASCAVAKVRKKNCGCGDKVHYFDTDGKLFPCTFITPMTFSEDDIKAIGNYDFGNIDDFVDEDCFNNCYIYQICRTCHAEDYLTTKSFKQYDKSKCRMKIMEAIVIAEYNARLIQKSPRIFDNTKMYYTIEAIKRIKELYYNDYKKYFEIMEDSENPEKSKII